MALQIDTTAASALQVRVFFSFFVILFFYFYFKRCRLEIDVVYYRKFLIDEGVYVFKVENFGVFL